VTFVTFVTLFPTPAKEVSCIVTRGRGNNLTKVTKVTNHSPAFFDVDRAMSFVSPSLGYQIASMSSAAAIWAA